MICSVTVSQCWNCHESWGPCILIGEGGTGRGDPATWLSAVNAFNKRKNDQSNITSDETALHSIDSVRGVFRGALRLPPPPFESEKIDLCWCHEHHNGSYSPSWSKTCSRMHQNAQFRRRKCYIICISCVSSSTWMANKHKQCNRLGMRVQCILNILRIYSLAMCSLLKSSALCAIRTAYFVTMKVASQQSRQLHRLRHFLSLQPQPDGHLFAVRHLHVDGC